MQLSIHAPDNLPLPRIQQRIRELEQSLCEEAHLLATQMPPNPAKNTNAIKALLLSMPPVGDDKDFVRHQDLGRTEALWDS